MKCMTRQILIWNSHQLFLFLGIPNHFYLDKLSRKSYKKDSTFFGTSCHNNIRPNPLCKHLQDSKVDEKFKPEKRCRMKAGIKDIMTELHDQISISFVIMSNFNFYMYYDEQSK